MKIKLSTSFLINSCFLIMSLLINPAISQQPEKEKYLDDRVQKFLESRRGMWRDMNVPAADGKILYDIIINNKYKKALEIGTSNEKTIHPNEKSANAQIYVNENN